MKTIVKERYLERIKALKDPPDIKIITGIRRSGKSNIMQVYMEYHALHKFVEDRYSYTICSVTCEKEN